MNEVEKMYENAGIKKCIRKLQSCEPIQEVCEECEYNWYPEFDTEKQLELIKLLCTKRYIDIIFTPEKEYYIFAYYIGCGFNKNFDEALAMFVNQYWNELSEEERKQIKEILNS